MINRKKTQRLHREAGLSVRRRDRRRATGARAPLIFRAVPNARWPVGFVHGRFANGRRFRVLIVVDDVAKECLAAAVDTRVSGRVARELTALVERRGKPGLIVSDHGTGFTSNAMMAWPGNAKAPRHSAAPGKPRWRCGAGAATPRGPE